MKENSGIRKININLSEKAFEELSSLSKKTNRSMTEIIRLGVGLAKIALEARGDGQRLFISTKEGEPTREIILP